MRDIKKYTNEYLASDFEAYQVKYRRKKVVETINKYEHDRILEIGCGMEPLFCYLDCDYNIYTVIEPSEIFFENAKKKSIGYLNVNLINDFFKVTDNIKKTKYNFIICSGLLHEVEDPAKLLGEIREACHENTVLHVNVPNAYSFHRVLAYEMGLLSDVHEMSERNIHLQQNNVYDINSLIDIVESVGFEVIEKGSYFCKPFSHRQMYEMIKEGIITDAVLDGLFSITRFFPEYGSEIYVNLRRI